jgi:hypothetical protein
LKAWSASAAAVAEHLVRNSKLGRKFDPQEKVASVGKATGLPEEDIRLGVLDQAGNGLVEKSRRSAPIAFGRRTACLSSSMNILWISAPSRMAS